MVRRSDQDGGLRGWGPLLVLLAVLVTVVALVRTSQTDTAGPIASPSPSPAPTASPAADPTVALFIGDAYTAGVGASSGAARWTSLVAAERGWLELNLGRSGTGYLAQPPTSVCGYSVCPPFPAMALRAVEEHPDVVVVSGGQNDTILAAGDPWIAREAIASTFATIRAGLPEAEIIGVGPKPIWGVSDRLLFIEREVREAVAAVCGTFVSLIDPGVLQESFMLDNGIHVNDEGHRAIARRVLAAMHGSASGDCLFPEPGSEAPLS